MPATAVPVREFLQLLEKSNLLSAAQFAQARSEAERFGDADDATGVARRVFQLGLVTRWQAQMLLAGRHTFFLGKYKLLERVGSGGMGSVFKAEQAPIGRIVAVKVMSPQLLKGRGSIARFHREIQAAAALDHPHIVAAYDADRAGKTHFLVMEYVEGENLSEVLQRRSRLPVGEACRLIYQASLGLQHAFERGMVHRDIKPSNLLLKIEDAQPIVKILDMGLARIAGDAEQGGLTQTGDIMGTPDYIAPEQARDSKAADIRSDIYSLGCTLFRLLTGKLPFGGSSLMEKLMARVEHDAPPPSSFRSEIPPELDEVAGRMLARNPADRYQTPAEAAAALAPFATAETEAAAGAASSGVQSGGRNDTPTDERDAQVPMIVTDPVSSDSGADSDVRQFLQDLGNEASVAPGPDPSTLSGDAGTPVAGPAPAGFVRPWEDESASGSGHEVRLDRRRKTDRRMLLAAGGAVALVLILAVGYLVWRRLGETTLIVDWPPEERAGGTLVVDGRTVSLPESGSLRFRGRPGRRTVRAARSGYRPISKSWEVGRGGEATFKPQWRPTDETVRRRELDSLRERVDSADLEQLDDEAFAELRAAAAAFCRDHPGTGEALQAAGLLYRLRWPVDLLRREDIDQYELQTAGGGEAAGAPEQLVAVLGDSRLSHTAGAVMGIAYSPDGRLIATTGEDMRIRLWDPNTGRQLRSIRVGNNNPLTPAFSSDSRLLTARYRNQTVGVWEVETGKLIQEFRGHAGNVFQAVFSPDSQWIASSDQEGTVVWNVESGEERFRIPGHPWEVGFGPDGKLLATVEKPGGAIGIWNAQTGQKVETAIRGRGHMGVGGDGLLACLSEDGGALLVWELATGRQRMSVPLKGYQRSPAISADGKYVAVVTAGIVRQFAIETGQERRAAIETFDAITVAYSPDGQTLATGHRGGSIQLWDSETGEQRIRPAGHRGRVAAVAVSDDGRWIASGGADGLARLWDVATGEEIRAFRGHQHEITGIGFALGGARLATASWDGTVRLWNVDTGRQVRTLMGHFKPVLALACHPGGGLLATGGADNTVRLWDAETGTEVRALTGHSSHVQAVTFSPDGRRLASAGYNAHLDGILLWDTSSGKRLGSLKLPERRRNETSLDFQPDGKILAAGGWGSSNNTIRLWEVAASRIRREEPGTGEYVRALFQPQGRLWLRSVGEGFFSVHNTRFGYAEHEFRLGQGHFLVGDAAWTPDGRHFAAGTGTGTVCLFRIKPWSPDLDPDEEAALPF